MRIGVIYGGISSEREVSIKTAEEIIKNLKHDVVELRIDKKEDLFKIKDLNVDFVYIALHGKFGEDGSVQAILDSMDIAYSGSGLLTSAICMDKDICKRIISSYGINTAKWITVRKGEKLKEYPSYLGSKLIVKPNSGGSSIGINFVTNFDELNRALDEVFKIDDEALIEEVIEGIEVSVPIIDSKVYPVVKIEALKSTFFDYASKYEDGGAREFVYEFEKDIQEKLQEYTKKAYYAVKAKGFCRIDYLIRGKEVFLIEINTLPGMTKASLLPKSLAYSGYSYADTIELLIKSSMGGNDEKNI